MKRTITILSMLLLTAGSTAFWQSCKKKTTDNNTVTSATDPVAVSIQTGARSIEPGSPMTYEAVLVDSKGNTSAATGVTWSVSNSLGTFAGNVFTPSAKGSGTITASVVVKGKTLTAQVPVGVYLPAVFTTLPSAIIWTTNAGTIPLTNVYLGTGTVTGYTYASSNTAIASVDASGNVSFNSTGECTITVTANGLSENNKVIVPVLVVGMPAVTLPVVRVAVNPVSKEMFRDETATFKATAYNSANAEVSSTFTWTSQDPNVASVDATGKVTAKALGKTIITATTNGIVGQAEVDVMPDSAIIVTPIMASLSPNGKKQFTAQAYKVNHTTKKLDAIAMPAGLKWTIPTTGIPIFDIATVDANGLVTMNSGATVGLSTVVLATVSSPTIAEGAGLVMVSDCDCGTKTPGVTKISVAGGNTLNLSIGSMPVTVNATALDASNNPVAGATVKFCSDNMTVCTVDPTSGTLIAAGPGTAIVTACNGDVQTTITVTVN